MHNYLIKFRIQLVPYRCTALRWLTPDFLITRYTALNSFPLLRLYSEVSVRYLAVKR